jgi:hypothetical protein
MKYLVFFAIIGIGLAGIALAISDAAIRVLFGYRCVEGRWVRPW